MKKFLFEDQSSSIGRALYAGSNPVFGTNCPLYVIVGKRSILLDVPGQLWRFDSSMDN